MRSFFRPKTGLAPFVCPIQSSAKIAILTGGFEESRRVRVFAEGWGEAAARFRPDIVAGPLSELRKLARERVQIGQAIVVFTHAAENTLSASDRDWLWEMLGVPVFQQVLGPANELLAEECEAHGGLHVVAAMEGVETEEVVCACGNTMQRVMKQTPQFALATAS